MAIKNEKGTPLGQILIIGQHDADRAVWKLYARAERVPKGEGKDDHGTPGVHGMRTLWMRSVTRKIGTAKGPKDFLDPTLLEAFVPHNDDGDRFRIEIFGQSAKVELEAEERIDIAPLREQPAYVDPDLYVTPFEIAAGALSVADAASLGAILPALDASGRVDFDLHGVEYTAQVVPPNGGAAIASRVRLTLAGKRAMLKLIPEKLAPASTLAWLLAWRQMQSNADTTRDSAWVRLGFDVRSTVPVLTWVVDVKLGKLEPNWEAAFLPPGLVNITLADQPIESQLLGPDAFMTLTPAGVTIRRSGARIELEAGVVSSADLVYRYQRAGQSVNKPVEQLGFPGALPVVHNPEAVRASLRRAYPSFDTTGRAALTGFMPVAGGWVELPFAEKPSLPAKLETRRDQAQAHGRMQLGLRRPELHNREPGAMPLQMPWSLRIEPPAAFQVKMVFDNGQVTSIDIQMQESAVQARGLVWLAGREPDGHDALPVIDNDPASFFDVVLDRAQAKPAAPFSLNGLSITAPLQPKHGWDDIGTPRWKRAPALDAGFGFTVNLAMLADDVKVAARAWLRHPTLPLIQCMPATRSDPTSTRPHASRALTLFAGTTAELKFNQAAGMAPSLDAAHRDKLEAVAASGGAAPALVALSLPGIELGAVTPARYRVLGRFSLPVLDEGYARATLPMPPDAEPVPPPAPVTALQPSELNAMWSEQIRLRAVAATQNSILFDWGDTGAVIAFAPSALAEPRALHAAATVSDAVTINGAQLTMGRLTLEQTAPPWRWEGSGDELLAGPNAFLDFANAGSVTILSSGQVHLTGWSFDERTDGDIVFDGRGIGWSATSHPAGDLILREMRIEEANSETVRMLASTLVPLPVGGTGDVPWRLAFTDIPMPAAGAGSWVPGTYDARVAGFERAWTYSLFPVGEWRVAPLPLHTIFRFAPAAFKGVEIDAAGKVKSVTVEGVLTLGDEDNLCHPADSRCRVALRFDDDANQRMLMLKALKPLDDSAGKRMTWDLDAVRDGSAIASGIAQFSAEPGLDDGMLLLRGATLELTLFGCRTTIALGNVPADAALMSIRLPAPTNDLVLGLTRLEIDLARASLKVIGFSARLREGVSVDLTEGLSESDAGQGAVASMDWFGNRIGWSIDIDDMRRTVVLYDPSADGIGIFPGTGNGRIDSGILCLTMDVPVNEAQFAVVTHFFELMLKTDEDLAVSHLMHSTPNSGGATQDALRFDGAVSRTSLVKWPDLDPVDPANADSVNVEFSTAGVVTHEAAFLLADHRLPGSLVRKAATRGLALNKPTPGAAPVLWLTEATHSLSWRHGQATDVRRFQCVHTLQLWAASDLAASLQQHGAEFGFTPSYVGANRHPADFPNHGVRQVWHAFTGLFEDGLPALIEALGESWVMLGNISALCPRDQQNLFQPLHLPFFGQLAGQAPPATLITRLSPPESSRASMLRMSRHDVLGTPIRINASSASPAGDIATLPAPMPIAFARAALAPRSLSGAAMAAGWFGEDAGPVESGLHVEQIQFPGKSDQRPPMPHPFPRAAVMLGYVKHNVAIGNLPVLSVLVQATGKGKKFAAKVETVLPQATPSTKPGASPAMRKVELIIGDASGLSSLWVDAADAGPANARQLLALALAHTGEPTFLVQRDVREGEQLACTGIEIPARRRDQLSFASRPLRSKRTFPIDGRLTWPEPADLDSDAKRQLHAALGARAPFQHEALGLAGLSGSVAPARVTGGTFTFGSQQASDTVWLQEWERVAFSAAPNDPEDAQPRAYDSVVQVMPMAPSAAAVADSIGRMDPSLQQLGVARMQTYLPPVIDDIDLPMRTGTLTESGLRVLRTWDDGAGRLDAQALAGEAVTRTMRTPRPVAIPPNTGDSSLWRRTVGWYADASASCLALEGAWDMLVGEPSSEKAIAGIPKWCILLGKPARAGLAPGQEQRWNGTVRVSCEVFTVGLDGVRKRLKNPARYVIDVLDKESASVRAGLRWGEDLIEYRRVRAVSGWELEFMPAEPAAALTEARPSRFECGWTVLDRSYAESALEKLELPAYSNKQTTLEPAAFRRLILSVPQLSADRFPLPVSQNTIFFSDPDFDRRLSRVKALSDSVDDTDGKTISFWIDRPAVTPGESLVLRGYSSDPKYQNFKLSASVRRKNSRSSAASPALSFRFTSGSEPSLQLDIGNGEYWALPLSILADDQGARLAPGDTLQLQLITADLPKPLAVRLSIPVRMQSSLSAPDALYSLIAVDSATPRAWCPAHSSAPQPEGLSFHVRIEESGHRVERRAQFKWKVMQNSADQADGFSICKTDLATESTHVTEAVERTLQSPKKKASPP